MPKLKRMFDGVIDTSLFKNPDTGQTLENYMYEVYGDLKIYMNDRPVLLATYLIAIAGIYFARAVAGSIALALKKSKP